MVTRVYPDYTKRMGAANKTTVLDCPDSLRARKMGTDKTYTLFTYNKQVI